MPQVLMPIGDGTEVLDTLYAYFRLPEDGFQPVLAGPDVRVYHGVMQRSPTGGADSLGHHPRAARLPPQGRDCISQH